MRHKAPVLLVLLFACFLPAMASVTSQRQSKDTPALSVDSQNQSSYHGVNSPDRPFFTEFYLQQFAAEPMPTSPREQRSWFSPMLDPVTSAASSLSRRVANLRHALVRMMP